MPSAAGEAAGAGAQITNKRDGSGITDCQSPGPVLSSAGLPCSLEGWMVFSSCCPFHCKPGIFPLVPGETLQDLFKRNELVLVKEGQCTACLLFSSPWTTNFKHGKKQGSISSLLVRSGLSGLWFALPCWSSGTGPSREYTCGLSWWKPVRSPWG